MTADEKSVEIPKKWRYLSNSVLALGIALGGFCGLVVFAVGQALQGIGSGLAGNAGGSGIKLIEFTELILLSGGGALIGSLPGFAFRYWVRKTKRSRGVEMK
jgi:hypothetical protein